MGVEELEEVGRVRGVCRKEEDPEFPNAGAMPSTLEEVPAKPSEPEIPVAEPKIADFYAALPEPAPL